VTGQSLLKLAAKAAGYQVKRFLAPGFDGEPKGAVVFDPKGRGRFTWRPRHDDGDAFRLAVRLGLCVSHWPRHDPPDVMVGYSAGPQHGANIITPYEGDPDAATREAIFQAAAETGRAMP
jgi:hypothetical protein